VIVCADDAGFAESSDRAILRCFTDGVLRAASVSVTRPGAERFVQEALAVGLEVGLHLDLTEGPPLTGVIPGIASTGISFLKDKQATWTLLSAEPESELGEALAAEVRAQWARLVEWGATPSHLNGHNHVHVLPAVRRALCLLIESEPVPFVRVPCEWVDPHEHPSDFRGLAGFCTSLRTEVMAFGAQTARFTGYGFSEAPSTVELLASLGKGIALEVMVHPGARPGSPFTESDNRDQETMVLTDPALPAVLAERGYAPMGFTEATRLRGTKPQ
jgi:predicted glycoside hydrolase/deacetylase ChbG (UPF0249 family)